MTKEEVFKMTKEEVVQEAKNSIRTCMSLIDEGNVDGCIDRMLNLCHKLVVNNQVTFKDELLTLIGKAIERPEIRIHKLNNLVDYFETIALYIDVTGYDGPSLLENYIDHITEVEKLDEMDRCYIFSRIAKNGRIVSCAGRIIARGLFKNIEW